MIKLFSVKILKNLLNNKKMICFEYFTSFNTLEESLSEKYFPQNGQKLTLKSSKLSNFFPFFKIVLKKKINKEHNFQ